MAAAQAPASPKSRRLTMGNHVRRSLSPPRVRQTTSAISQSPQAKRTSMNFLNNFLKTNNSSGASGSSSGGVALDEDDFRALQQHLASTKGAIVSNATFRHEAAKFLEAKKKRIDTLSQEEEKRAAGNWGKLAAGFRTTKNTVAQTSVEASRRFAPSIGGRDVNLSDPMLPSQLDKDKKKKGVKDGDKKKKKKKDKDKTRRKVFQSLSDERVPKEQGLRQRKKKNATFIQDKFPAVEPSAHTSRTDASKSMDLSLPSNRSYKKEPEEDDEKFIDGLVFFAGEKNEKRIRKMVKNQSRESLS